MTVARRTVSAEHSLRRVAATALVGGWVLVLAEAFFRCYPHGHASTHWFPYMTLALFGVTVAGLVAALIVRGRRALIVALRGVPVAFALSTALLAVRDLGPGYISFDGIWFTSSTAIAAVALLISTSLHIAVPCSVVLVAGITLLNGLAEGRDGWFSLTAEVVYALLFPAPLIIIAAMTMLVTREIDRTEQATRARQAEESRQQSAVAEMTRFAALIHDRVLSTLNGIGRGIRPDEPVGIGLVILADEDGQLSAAQFADAVTAVVHRRTPTCRVTVTGDGVVPGSVATTVTLALAETVKNSAVHAPGAARTCAVAVEESGVRVIFTDDGPGFRPEDVGGASAGVRISIGGRMRALEGGDARVSSTPGEGTIVELTWMRGTDAEDPEDTTVDGAAGTSTAGQSDVESLDVFRLLRLGLVFHPWYWAAMSVILAAMVVVNGRPTDPWTILTYIFAVTLLGVVCAGRGYPLPLPGTLVVVLGGGLMSGVGLWQNLYDTPAWSQGWHIMAQVILAYLLALRGRITAGILTVLFSAGVVQAVQVFADPVVWWISGLKVLSWNSMVIAGILVTLGAGRAAAELPVAQRVLRRAERGAAAVTGAADRRRMNLDRLARDIGPLLREINESATLTDELTERARLTELRLRDTLRSPRLDIPVLHQAAWDARRRGVTVVLLDDRGETVGGSGDVGISGHVLEHVLESLAAAVEGTTVTFRMLPQGRSTYATLSDSSGLRRFGPDPDSSSCC